MATTMSEAAVSPRIRAVILDYGEVLCFQPAADAIARMARIFRIDPESFLPIYIQGRGPTIGEIFYLKNIGTHSRRKLE